MRIVMTGGTSGIGLVAARAFLGTPDTHLLIGTRQPAGSPADLAGATLLPLDLGSLASTRQFAARAAEAPIDALVFNAGLQVTKPQWSSEGFELTFASNHLAHQLLVRLLAPHLAPNARVILTASGTHDPALKSAMPAPHHADAEKLAHPDRDALRDDNAGKACRRAYSASKLCNIMTVREFARRSAADRPDLMVAAFDPGYVPATGLARDYPAFVRWLAPKVISRIAGPANVSTPDISGRHLAALVTDQGYAASRGDYWSVRSKRLVNAQPSQLARDPEAARRLWDESAALVGLAGEPRPRTAAADAGDPPLRRRQDPAYAAPCNDSVR